MTQPLPGIDHVILLMFENRSFDNMLGAVYRGAVDRGGVPANWSNPYEGGAIPPWQGPAASAAQTIPYPDPQESYDHMQAQINSSFGPMMGFATDYASVPSDPKAIMQYYVAKN